MTLRESTMNILTYKSYETFPIVHFGFWGETLEKWNKEGYISKEEMNEKDCAEKLGFDFGWNCVMGTGADLRPYFEKEIIERLKDGSYKMRNCDGVIVLQKDAVRSIPAEIDHLLKTRADWEKHYKHRFQYTEDRFLEAKVNINNKSIAFKDGGKEEILKNETTNMPIGVHIGSLMGRIRDILGVEGLAYMFIDDEDLFKEMIDTTANLIYDCLKGVLDTGVRFDFGHFWEDICFKNGPLVVPAVFEELVGPHYKRITSLLKEHGTEIVSLDCDGMIDALLPIWLENGVNTMFPIEVGTWKASIKTWREQYGKSLRGVGGMDKKVFAFEKSDIDAEIERLKPLIELGGYIPCPDHRIPPDAKWENVVYYCEKARKEFN